MQQSNRVDGNLSGVYAEDVGWGLTNNAFFIHFLFLFLLVGCAGRAPELTPVVQSIDQYSTCDQIIAEIKANNQRMSDLAAEEGLKVTQNVAAGVIGLVVWPVWFGMDFQDAAGKEGKALSQRNEYLGTLARDRCGQRTENIPYRDPRSARETRN